MPYAAKAKAQQFTRRKPNFKDVIVIDKTDDIDDNSSDRNFTRIRLQPKPIFRRPRFSREIKQDKKTTSLNRSSGVDNSQGVSPSVFLISTRDFC